MTWRIEEELASTLREIDAFTARPSGSCGSCNNPSRHESPCFCCWAAFGPVEAKIRACVEEMRDALRLRRRVCGKWTVLETRDPKMYGPCCGPGGFYLDWDPKTWEWSVEFKERPRYVVTSCPWCSTILPTRKEIERAFP